MVHQNMPRETTNVLSTVKASLPASTFTLLEAVAQKASQNGMHLYLVGGCVRDILLGAPVKDLDIVVEGNAALLAFEVSKELSGDVPAYSQFGTATVKLEGQRLDLATARQESYVRPGALPRVTPSTIQEDLGRRDFSINAMAIALSGRRPGRVLDTNRGKEDLGLGLVRVLHPRSFRDDPTRILRAIRYEQRLNFRVEEETHTLLLEAVHGGALDTVSGSRIRRELELMFEEERPHLPLYRCGELGVLRAIHPPLGDGSAVKTLAGQGGEDLPLAYLAALSYPMVAQEGETFVARLRMPIRWAKVVRDTISVRLKSGGDPGSRPHIGEPGLSPSQLCNFLDQVSPTSVQVNALSSESAPVKEALEGYLTQLRYVKASLNGRTLISLGVAQGPAVGEVLRKLRNGRIEGRITTREEEVRLVKEYVSKAGG